MCNVFFGNSGAEANEGAIKFARKYSFDKYGEGRSTIITLVDSFHGRTITTLAATGQDCFHTTFGPFTPGFKYCPANDIEKLNEMITDDVCAIMFECIQGEGGVNNLSPEFVKEIEKIANEKDILMVVAERVNILLTKTSELNRILYQRQKVLQAACLWVRLYSVTS